MDLYLGGLNIGRIFASEIWGEGGGGLFLGGLIFEGVYYRNFTVTETGEHYAWA